MLSQHMEQLRAMATNKECDPAPPPPPPLFPSLPENTSCGFIPPMATLQHATVCLMANCSDKVREGDRVSVTAIGSIDQSGYFSVDSRTSVYQTPLSEWTLHRHGLLIRTIDPIIRDSFRGWEALVLLTLEINLEFF